MATVDEKRGTPVKALIFTSALTMIIQILIPNFPSAALVASITTLVPYAAAALALPVLRKNRPEVGRPVKVPFALAVAVVGFVGASTFVYWAAWPWTLVGAILMILGAPFFHLFKRPIAGEIKRTAWIWVYLIGLAVLSYIGDPFFTFANFLPIGPIGLLRYPYDGIVVVVFSLLIFGWAYKSSVRRVA
jgi:APA family basic amino acid/polyamine antiporter